MVYYKRAVLASCFALASSISAKEVIPSLKEIIHEITEDNVRVRIETAYMNGNFDEVEKGLFSYLDEYNFDSSAVENVQEVKEKAWSIISEGVEEMRTAAYVDSPDVEEYVKLSPFEEDAGPSPAGEDAEPSPAGDDTGPSPAGQDAGPSPTGKDTGPSPAGQDAGPSPAGENAGPSPAGQDAGPSPAGQDAGPVNEEYKKMIKALTSKSIFEIVDTMPKSEVKTKLLKDICDNDEALSEADVEQISNAFMPPGVPDTSTVDFKAFLSFKVYEHFRSGGSAEGCGGSHAVVPQLMEGKSDVVDALHDITVTQQKIVDLINELEGGL